MLREAREACHLASCRSTATVSTSVVDLLVTHETIDGAAVYGLAGRAQPDTATVGVTMAPNRDVAVSKASASRASQPAEERSGV